MKRLLGTLMKNTRRLAHHMKRSSMQLGEFYGTDRSVCGSRKAQEDMHLGVGMDGGCFGTGQYCCCSWGAVFYLKNYPIWNTFHPRDGRD